MTVVELARLDANEIDRLIDATAVALSPDQRRVVRARSEGVPLLVTELLTGRDGGASTAPIDPIPPSFAALVDDRLGTLDRPTRELLGIASVLGERPDWDLVARVGGVDPPAVVAGAGVAGVDPPAVVAGARLRTAVAAHLLVIDGGELRWRHVLTRDAVRASLLPPERRRIGLLVAEAVLAQDGPDPQVADLLAEAGQPSRAAALLLDLADRELARGTVRSAEVLLDRAEQVAGAGPRLAPGHGSSCTP